MTDFKGALYPNWQEPIVKLPGWVVWFGLSKTAPVVGRVYASAPHWQQAEADGLTNVAPVLVLFNAAPREVRREIGGEAWKRVHHGSLKSNVDLLVLRMVMGWTLEEALQFPANHHRRAKSYRGVGKSALLTACRLGRGDEDFRAQMIMARDVQRMGGELSPEWGRKRLKREHDALVMANVMRSADSTPWSRPWFHDVGDYSFSLLKSEAELVLEGACQRHCVSSYARAAKAGREVILRIEGAERATCSWRVGDSHIQVKGFANTDVTPACRSAAREARKAWTAWAREEAA